jgi:hypothetical protein
MRKYQTARARLTECIHFEERFGSLEEYVLTERQMTIT